ncbi:TPA: hypothetical protein MYU63_004909 [Citrobacter amalonaticus]|nr:hypothetical protein [Citrobacter amalonaticus]
MNKAHKTAECANKYAHELRAEQLYYLLQTLAENYNSMEDVQKFSLIEIAWNFSGDVSAWFSAKESCEK